MTTDEAHKINELFKQIDLLTTENTALKAVPPAPNTDQLTTKLDSIESKLDKLLTKSTAK